MGVCSNCNGAGTVRTGRYRVTGSYRSYEEVTCMSCLGKGRIEPLIKSPSPEPRARPAGGKSGSSSLGSALVLLVGGFLVWGWLNDRSPNNATRESPPTVIPDAQAAVPPARPVPVPESEAQQDPPVAPIAAPASATPVSAIQGSLAPEDFNIARRTDLPFYPSTQLWEFGRWGADALAAYLVPSNGVPILLDGTSSPIHRYNTAIGLNLTDPEVAADYLRFFTAFLWSDEGAFRIIETRSALPRSAENDGSIQPRLLRLDAAGEGFETSTLVLYGDELSDSRFRVLRTGTVEMLDERHVAKISPDIIFRAGQRRPATLEGLDAEHWPLPPPLPGAWGNATSDELARVRQLIVNAPR